MNLRTKLLLGIGIALIATFAMVAAFSVIAMEESYRTIEEKEVITTVQRAQSSLNTDQRNLQSVTRDYAAWTETLLFAQGQNPDWIGTNTGNDFFERFSIQGVLVFNTTKELVFSKGYNSSLHVNEEIPESLITEIRDLIDPSAILESEEGLLPSSFKTWITVSSACITGSSSSRSLMLPYNGSSQSWLGRIIQLASVALERLTPRPAQSFSWR